MTPSLSAPAGAPAIEVVGCHAEGEVGDVIVAGVPTPPGATMMERKLAFERSSDHIRRRLIQEPRGSVARHVNLLLPAIRPDCAFGAIVMEPTEYPPMSGSNAMCIATVLLETGRIEMREPETRFSLDMPAGKVDIIAECRAGKCVSVTIANVPSLVLALDVPLDVAGLGRISVDLAYGGMIYAIVDAGRLGFNIVPEEARTLADLGERIRVAARAQHPISHPVETAISGVSIVQFAGPLRPTADGFIARNSCIVAPGRCDRSPTGTGISARMAVLNAKGLLKAGQSLAHESIIGSRFTGRIVGETVVAGRPAILPTITGRAWITGHHRYSVDPTDPWPDGYRIADTWGNGTSLDPLQR